MVTTELDQKLRYEPQSKQIPPKQIPHYIRTIIYPCYVADFATPVGRERLLAHAAVQTGWSYERILRAVLLHVVQRQRLQQQSIRQS